jgi:poly(3-hydroxybutyrate) depolymerase
MTLRLPVLAAICFLAAARLAMARGAATGTTYDEALPPGADFDKAEFRFWLPSGASAVRALVVLVPGSNGDGRAMAADVFWQEFAAKHRLALVACGFTDKPHDPANLPGTPAAPNAWLVSERLARAWQAAMTPK